MSVQPVSVGATQPNQVAVGTQGTTRSDTAAISADPAGNIRAEQQQAVSPAASAEEISAALEEVETALRPVAGTLNFSLDDESGQTLVKVVDRETDEVIRQIPSEELMRISKALDTLRGLLLNNEA